MNFAFINSSTIFRAHLVEYPSLFPSSLYDISAYIVPLNQRLFENASCHRIR